MKKLSLILAAILTVSLASCGITAGETMADLPSSEVISEPSSEPEPDPSSVPEPSSEPEPEPEPSVVHFRSAGDDLIHNSLYEQANARAGYDGYDFTYAYANLGSLIADADIATLNQETVIAPDRAPSTYPCFNSPPELAQTITELGFDVFCVANNHVLDKGESGLISCLEFWRDNYPDALITGAYLNEEDYADLRLMEKNGLTFAFLGMTELTNGLSLPQGSEVVLMLGQNEEMLKTRIEAAKAAADVVIINVHWGNEYTHTPTDRQRYLAEKIADWGADIIIGHHPHVLQPIETRTTADGREALIAYSLGNFISAQDRAPRMVGGILDYTVRRETPESPVEITDISFIPTVTHYDWGFSNNRIYPLSDYTEELAQNHGVRSKDPDFSLEYINGLLNEVIGEEYLQIGEQVN